MKKIVLTGRNSPGSLERVESEIPRPGKNEILIQVKHAGVSFADAMMRYKAYPGAPKMPFTPGFDVCGNVVKIGAAVNHLQVGDRVIALTRYGGYAEFAVSSADLAMKIPDQTRTDEAVALVLNYVTAHQMLVKYRKFASDDSLLVYAAAGGVGTALLQLASSMGLQVFGACSTKKTAIVERCGGIALDYKTTDIVSEIKKRKPGGVTTVLDPIAGPHFDRSRLLVQKGGDLIGFGVLNLFSGDRITGSMFKNMLKIASMYLFSRGFHFHFFRLNQTDRAAFIRSLRSVFDLYVTGKIKPIIGKEYLLQDALLAHEDIVTGRSHGKLVLNCAL